MTSTRTLPEPPLGLRLLVGEARAAVIAVLRSRQTTGTVASSIHVAPSTASAHLNTLSRTGLIDRHRRGRFVYYQLNDRGAALLELFAEPAAGKASAP